MGVHPERECESPLGIDCLSDAGSGVDMSSGSEVGVPDPDLDMVPAASAQTVDGLRQTSRRGEGLKQHNDLRRKTHTEKADRLGLAGKARHRLHNLLRRSSDKTKAAARNFVMSQHALSSVSAAWNKDKLRRGDKLDPHNGMRCSNRGGRAVHPSAWTLQGTIEMAFKCIGSFSPDANSLRMTRRPLDGVAVVSLAAKDHQHGATKTWLNSFETGAAGAKWVLHGRSRDCTPLRVGFGLLRELAAVARYRHREPRSSSAKLLSTDDYKRKCGKMPSHGIVELMAQSGDVAWPEMVTDEFPNFASAVIDFPFVLCRFHFSINVVFSIAGCRPVLDSRAACVIDISG